MVDFSAMSGAPVKPPATYADLVALPSHLVGEIVDGELIASPRPAPPHALACTALGADLFTMFGRSGGGRPGGWTIIYEPELHVVGQVMVPDIAGGGASGCRSFLACRTSKPLPIGSAKCTRRAPSRSIERRRCTTMRAPAWGISGFWIRGRNCWRSFAWKAAAGTVSPAPPVTTRSAGNHSMRWS